MPIWSNLTSADYDDTLFPEPRAVECSLSESGRLKLVRVKRGCRQQSRRWNTMMHRYHYSGENPLCGCQIRYFIESEPFGTLGVLTFSASAWSVSEVQKPCPDTLFVSVGDRDADIYDLFHLGLSDPENPKILVRASHDRMLAEGNGKPW